MQRCFRARHVIQALFALATLRSAALASVLRTSGVGSIAPRKQDYGFELLHVVIGVAN